MHNSCIFKKPRIWQVFWYMTWYGKNIRKKYRRRKVLWANALIQLPRKTGEQNHGGTCISLAIQTNLSRLNSLVCQIINVRRTIVYPNDMDKYFNTTKTLTGLFTHTNWQLLFKFGCAAGELCCLQTTLVQFGYNCAACTLYNICIVGFNPAENGSLFLWFDE